MKHAKALSIKVSIHTEGNKLFIIIKDNGKGFDEKEYKNGGFGLSNMRQNIQEIGGEISIDSIKGEGTVITVIYPL